MLHTHLSQSLRCATGLSASTLSHPWHLVRHNTAAKPTFCYNILSVLNFKKCEKHTFGIHMARAAILFLCPCIPTILLSADGSRDRAGEDLQRRQTKWTEWQGLPTLQWKDNRSLERSTSGILIYDTLNMRSINKTTKRWMIKECVKNEYEITRKGRGLILSYVWDDCRKLQLYTVEGQSPVL